MSCFVAGYVPLLSVADQGLFFCTMLSRLVLMPLLRERWGITSSSGMSRKYSFVSSDIIKVSSTLWRCFVT